MKNQSVHFANLRSNMPETVPHIVDYLVATAMKIGASDIHLGRNTAEENQSEYLVRFRVNGMLQMLKSSFIDGHYDEVVARIKVLANMDTNAVGEVQDGQMTLRTNDDMVVLRISVLPGMQGTEEVCIRLQKSSDKDFSLDDLMMTKQMRSQLDHLIHQKSGMFIMNGPAGSGKTTTIYSILKNLAGPTRKIITAEDPVELEIPYVNHVPITKKTSFADVARGFMRQDAEIIFIGEIRDAESAQTAQNLAQTGHLVFTTVHTRDSVGVVQRLAALGVHPNFIASTLVASLAQRLVPGLCSHCRVPMQADEEVLGKLNDILPIPQNVILYEKGPGCSHCRSEIHGMETQAGYHSRIPIFELFVVDADVADLINREGNKKDLIEYSMTKGMLTLAQEALVRLYQGHVDLRSIESLVFSPTYSL